MAYVRKKKTRGGEYYQLVESRRVEGKPRQRVLLHLGSYPTVDDALREWPREIERLRALPEEAKRLRRYIVGDAEEAEPWRFEMYGTWANEAERRASTAQRRADDLQVKLERLHDLRCRGLV